MPDRQTKDSTKLSQLGTGRRSTATSILLLPFSRGWRNTAIVCVTKTSASRITGRTPRSSPAISTISWMLSDCACHSQGRRNPRKGKQPVSPRWVRRTRRKRTAIWRLRHGRFGPPEFRKRIYEETLEAYFAFRSIHDLRRGWRVVLPNLEQCALLDIDYDHLDEIAAMDKLWTDVPLFNQLGASDRRELIA